MSSKATEEDANGSEPPRSTSTSPTTPHPAIVMRTTGAPCGVPPPAFANLFARRGRKKLHHYSACANTVADLRPCALTSSSSSAGKNGCSSGGGVDDLCGPSRARGRGRQCDPPTRILDFLYLGSVQDAQDATFLRAHNIQYIINVSEEEYWSVDKRIIVFPFKASDMDGFDISRFFRPTRQILDHVCRLYYKPARRLSTHGLPSTGATAGGPCVLVHCQRGRSRSATIVLAYLVYRNGWSVAEALRYVRSRRPSVEPNLGFLEALRVLQESMSVAERNAKCGRQSVVVKNVSRTTPAAVVQAFFETHVGMVRDVLIHHGSDGDRAGRRLAVPPRDNCARDGEGDHRESSVQGDEEQEAEDETRGTTATLCIVSFACAESVQRAKTFAAQHPAELRQLCPAEGKAVKVLLPAKIMASSAVAGATPHRPVTTAHSATTSPFHPTAVVDHAGLTRASNGPLSRHAPSAQHRRRAESMRLRSAALREGQHGVTPPRAVTTCSIPQV